MCGEFSRIARFSFRKSYARCHPVTISVGRLCSLLSAITANSPPARSWWRRRRRYKPQPRERCGSGLELVSLCSLFVIWFLSWTNGPLCDPNSPFQGHGVWLLLSAAAVGCLYKYFRAEEGTQTT